MKPRSFAIILAGLAVSAAFSPVNAMEVRELTLKNHQFTPQTVTIPADTRFKIVVDNQDATPAEFESDDFKREKIISGNSKATIFVSPLPKGEYAFFDEFNADSAKGTLIVE